MRLQNALVEGSGMLDNEKLDSLAEKLEGAKKYYLDALYSDETGRQHHAEVKAKRDLMAESTLDVVVELIELMKTERSDS